MANERIWYAVRCWEDVGGPEDGIVPVLYWKILRAPNIFKAYDMAKAQGAIPCYKDEGAPYYFSRAIPDVRIATKDEVSEHIYYDIKMLWQDRKEKIERYGLNGWLDWIHYINHTHGYADEY